MAGGLHSCLLCPPSLPIERAEMAEGLVWNDGFVRTKLGSVSVTAMRLNSQSSSHESVMHYLPTRLYKPWRLLFPSPYSVPLMSPQTECSLELKLGFLQLQENPGALGPHHLLPPVSTGSLPVLRAFLSVTQGVPTPSWFSELHLSDTLWPQPSPSAQSSPHLSPHGTILILVLRLNPLTMHLVYRSLCSFQKIVFAKDSHRHYFTYSPRFW